jgi:hypothetical protein
MNHGRGEHVQNSIVWAHQRLQGTSINDEFFVGLIAGATHR